LICDFAAAASYVMGGGHRARDRARHDGSCPRQYRRSRSRRKHLRSRLSSRSLSRSPLQRVIRNSRHHTALVPSGYRIGGGISSDRHHTDARSRSRSTSFPSVRSSQRRQLPRESTGISARKQPISRQQSSHPSRALQASPPKSIACPPVALLACSVVSCDAEPQGNKSCRDESGDAPFRTELASDHTTQPTAFHHGVSDCTPPKPNGEVADLLAEISLSKEENADPSEYWVAGTWDLEGLRSDAALCKQERDFR